MNGLILLNTPQNPAGLWKMCHDISNISQPLSNVLEKNGFIQKFKSRDFPLPFHESAKLFFINISKYIKNRMNSICSFYLS